MSGVGPGFAPSGRHLTTPVMPSKADLGILLPAHAQAPRQHRVRGSPRKGLGPGQLARKLLASRIAQSRRPLMQRHMAKPEVADIVAVLDTQDEADEAVLRLRMFGFSDDRIGYFCRTSAGDMTDASDRNHWLGGATIGAIVGAALGIGLARVLYGPVLPAGQGDLWGLAVTCVVFVGLFGTFVGGSIGSGIP